MLDKRCFRCNPTGSRCIALMVRECPTKCKARITDPEEYIEELKDMLTYNIKRTETCAQIRKDIKYVRKKYNLPGSKEGIKDKPGIYSGLDKVYWEEIHRGEKGSHSEGNVNNQAIKQRMKDNRPQECKLNREKKQEIYDATKQFEKEHGKLDKLSRGLLTRSKVDSYTGEDIE